MHDAVLNIPVHLIRLVALIGNQVLHAVAGFGRFCFFAKEVFVGLGHPKAWLRRERLGRQLFEVGTLSIPVLGITGAFIGMTLAFEGYRQFQAIGQEGRLGGVINLSIVKQLGPVLAGIMLAGRVGCALTAELGSMRVTEQLDAMRAMATDPVKVLVVPRMMACVLMIPILTVVSNACGVIGGWLVITRLYNADPAMYLRYSEQFVYGSGRQQGGDRHDLLLQGIQLQAGRRGRRCGDDRELRHELHGDHHPGRGVGQGAQRPDVLDAGWGELGVQVVERPRGAGLGRRPAWNLSDATWPSMTKTTEKIPRFFECAQLDGHYPAPILQELIARLKSDRPDHLPKSDVGQAISYVLEREETFTRYIDAGHVEIDNNACERSLRAVAVGRKNWMFAGSQFGGENAAAWFSLIGSAKLHEVEPWAYLTDVLRQLAMLGDNPSDEALTPLLPDQWIAANPKYQLPVGR
ncbi:MAG: ABC transporter permease [Planctomycetota bacterium]|nr:ABC transporter permease [Planctomycetota bacterium]